MFKKALCLFRFSIGVLEVQMLVHDRTRPDNWLIKLSNDLKMPFNLTASTDTRLVGGPDKAHSYVSALYFTMSCMSTVGESLKIYKFLVLLILINFRLW